MSLLTAALILGLLGPVERPQEHGKTEKSEKSEKTSTRAPLIPAKEKAKAAEAEEEHGKTTRAKDSRVKAKAKEEPKEEAEEPKAEPKPAPKPVVRRRPAVVPQAHAVAKLSAAELQAAKLVEENARLQQELARRQGLSLAEVRTPEDALAELVAGNERFVAGKRVRTLLSMQDVELREKLAKGQSPFAVVVTCSDSRLMDNLIFDQELGRLFTIREAGNSPDIQGIASAEYAAEHLGSKLLVIMGHSACGAVKAVQEAHGAPLPGNLWSFQAAMAGLLESSHGDPNETPGGQVNRLAAENAKRQARSVLGRSEILRHLVGAGKLKVVPAMYDLDSGKVSFFPVVGLDKPAEAAHH